MDTFYYASRGPGHRSTDYAKTSSRVALENLARQVEAMRVENEQLRRQLAGQNGLEERGRGTGQVTDLPPAAPLAPE